MCSTVPRRRNLGVEERVLSAHLRGLVERVACSTSHSTTSHLCPQVSLSGTESSQSGKDDRTNDNTGNRTSCNDTSSLSFVVIQETSDTTVLRGRRGGPVRDTVLIALLRLAVARTNVTIGVINDAWSGSCHATNIVVAKRDGTPVSGGRAHDCSPVATNRLNASSGDCALVRRDRAVHWFV